jgi:LAS superfamily LD-carboxypeptidase LdcB
MRYPVRKVTLPADLKGQKNGRLNESLLRAIHPAGHLHHLAAAAWRELRRAAKKDGLDLVHVGAYRSYRRQYDMFRSRYAKKPTGRRPPVTRTWNGLTWYLKKGRAPSAVPGTSNHGLGLALDVALRVNGKVLPISTDPDGKGQLPRGAEWLRRHATTYGWCWEVADPKNPNFEIWHLVYFQGDRPTTPTPNHHEEGHSS